MSIVEQFMGHDAGALVQFIKYGLAGGVATASHILVFHLTAWKLFPALQANDWFVKIFRIPVEHEADALRARNSMIDNGIAFMISNFVAYVINIYWVFEPGRHTWYIQLGLFYLVSGVSIVIGTAVMGWLIRRFGMSTTYAFIANLVSALLINYAMRKFVIFKG